MVMPKMGPVQPEHAQCVITDKRMDCMNPLSWADRLIIHSIL